LGPKLAKRQKTTDEWRWDGEKRKAGKVYEKDKCLL
jgi:hypothetical protein